MKIGLGDPHENPDSSINCDTEGGVQGSGDPVGQAPR